MNQLELFDKSRQTDITSTVFSDGMVVTADDLATAMSYPIELMQTLIRAYFGCGVVCGFEVEQLEYSLSIRVNPGTALDCHGHPLKLCAAEDIDLTPNPCASEVRPRGDVYIAISRDTALEAPRADGDGCDNSGQPGCQHRRQRELIRIKVFEAEDLPKTICQQGETTYGCEGLKTCPEDHCCGEAWVLLAHVRYQLVNPPVVRIDNNVRRYVKPIECQCGGPLGNVAEGITTTTSTTSGGSTSTAKTKAVKKKAPARKPRKKPGTAARQGQ